MIKLVIVDDHLHVREAWSWVLNQVPGLHVIAQCANGQEAIEAAKELQPDVMLMDIHMNPVNGLEATRMIRSFAPDIKIIGVSVQAERSYVTEMLRSGANGYVTKNSPSDGDGDGHRRGIGRARPISVKKWARCVPWQDYSSSYFNSASSLSSLKAMRGFSPSNWNS